MRSASQGELVLVTAASGYIGSRLLRALAENGRTLRASARDRRRVSAPGGVDVVTADALDAAAVAASLSGVTTAVYLVHTLGAGEG